MMVRDVVVEESLEVVQGPFFVLVTLGTVRSSQSGTGG